MEKSKREKRNRKSKQVGNGNGTFYFNEKLQRYVYQYSGKNGKRPSITQWKGESNKHFKDRVAELRVDLKNNTLLEKEKITVYELGLEILEGKLKRNKIQETTYCRDLQTLTLIEGNVIGATQIQKIEKKQIQNFMDEQTTYSNAVIDKIWQFLNRIFNEAIKRDYIIKSPMIYIEKPKSIKEDKKIEAFSIKEQKAFLNVLTKDEEYRDIFIIALYSGMRMGEILALEKNDIDFENKTIHIQRSLTRNKYGQTILGDTTKTYYSDRIIPITPLFENELKHAIKHMTLNIHNLLFTSPNGKWLSVSSINSVFNRLCCNANLNVHPYLIKRKDKTRGNKIREIQSKRSGYNQHMLRHTYATRMIESGVPAEVLQKLLGHKDIETTINTYTTIFDQFRDKEINKYIEYMQSIN